jgi:hypothetical protein
MFHHRGDLLSLDQHVAAYEIADLAVEAQNGAALDEDAAVGIDDLARDALGVGRSSPLGRLCCDGSGEHRHGGDQHGAGLEQIAPR